MTLSNDFLEVLSPNFLGSKRISLSLSDQTPVPKALQDVRIEIDYSEAEDYGGIVLPVLVMVQTPRKKGFRSDVFRKIAPTSYIFAPQEAGTHLVVVREVFHNRLHGTLALEVAGEPGE